jgi:hypothetical protein
MSEMSGDTGEGEEEGTELTESVYNVLEESGDDAADEDPEGGEEGAM